jgi:hypothetical protein
MPDNDWDATSIHRILEAPRIHNFGSDVTVLKSDETLNVVIGYTVSGSVFFGCPQVGQIKGFAKGRARLDVSQSIDLKERGLIEPALALSFLVNSDEELSAISAIFSGLYDLNKSGRGTEKATLAAQGFEDYFADMPKIGPTDEIEIGLFGELSVIATSTRKEELVRAWHSAPDATFDFSFDGNRLEVKTSTRPTRLVWLRGSQTLKDSDPGVTYLSIYAPLDDAGMNLTELSSRIRESLTPSARNIFDEKMAFYDISSCKKRFDFQTAAESFRFVSSSDIPIPNSDDPRILEIRWKCSFKNLPNDGDPAPWV